VLTLVNQRRAAGARCGSRTFAPARPLIVNAKLQLTARQHSADMAARDYYSHTSRDGRTFDVRIAAAGYAGSPIAENIAARHASPKALVAAWMASPGHCANIMSPEYRSTGLGHAYRAGSTYGHYWTQIFGGR
jgi:uncharacterized protein YkwD